MNSIVWKDIKNYEGLYRVSNFGDVFSVRRQRNIYQSIDRYGYKQCLLYKDGVHKTQKVHRLVAESFIEKVDGKTQVNHKDGIRTNNNVSNLEWCNNSENQLHSYRNNGRIPSNKYNNKRTRKRSMCYDNKTNRRNKN